jgi:hypothetical protein
MSSSGIGDWSHTSSVYRRVVMRRHDSERASESQRREEGDVAVKRNFVVMIFGCLDSFQILPP